MAFQTQEADFVAVEQARIGRTVGRMARLTAFDFHRSMLIDKRSGFISMAFETGHVVSDPRTQLLGLEPAVLVMTIRAFHGAFGNLVMEGPVEGRFLVHMA